MSQPPRTSKRLPPEVYTRRRIAVLVILVLLIALIWAGITAIAAWLTPGSNDQMQLPEGMSESSVVVESGEPCPVGTIVVEAVVGNSEGDSQLAFASDQTPHIWFTLTNTNSVDCTFNAGAKVQFFKITSGDQLIWTSKQCDRKDLEDTLVMLASSETIASPPQPWEKVFSSESGCGVEQSPVITGGASYFLDVEVNGELSTNSVQFVLN